MAGSLVKIGVGGIILVVLALIVAALIGPTIQTMQQQARIAELEKVSHAELVAYLQEEVKNIRLADPRDDRWWGKRLNNKEYGILEKALDAFLNDTERDGSAETNLYNALKQVGVDVGTNIADAVHAANHLVNKTPKPSDLEPLSPANEEDLKEWEQQNGK